MILPVLAQQTGKANGTLPQSSLESETKALGIRFVYGGHGRII